MKNKKSRTTLRTPKSKNRCNFQFADGRRCRMLLHKTTGELCLFHHRELLQLQSSAEIGAELLALGGNFRNPIAINFVLGKLFSHVATGRMHRRDASTLAYIAQLLLQTLDTKRYHLARDRHDYRAFKPALATRYAHPKSKRTQHAPSPHSESCVGAGLQSGLQATTNPNPTQQPAHDPDATRAQYPPPANPQFPEPLPDTPWFRKLVLERRALAQQQQQNPRAQL